MLDLEKVEEIISQRRGCVFDNIKRIEEEIADFLCSTVTGISISKRKLYTDSEVVQAWIQAVLLLNGISETSRQPDLRDRFLT